jgi:amino acid transporter
MSKHEGLARDSLGTLESIVMGVAGTAPAFSVAVTTATIVAAVGVLSVGSILYCGLIMFGITLAFIHLSKITPNAGAAYAWVGHVFGPRWGFFAGWGLLVASVFFYGVGDHSGGDINLVVLAPHLVDSTLGSWYCGPMVDGGHAGGDAGH